MSDNESNSRLSINSRKVKLRTFRLASKLGARIGGGGYADGDAGAPRQSRAASRETSKLRESLRMNDRHSIRSSLERRPPGKKLKLKLNAYS